MSSQGSEQPIMVVVWPCGDRAIGKTRNFRYRAVWRRLRWHWKHRCNGGVRFPPGQWWSLGKWMTEDEARAYERVRTQRSR